MSAPRPAPHARLRLAPLAVALLSALAAACRTTPDEPAESRPAATVPSAAPAAVETIAVRAGVDVVAERLPDVLRGKRIALITNHTGRDRAGRSTIDVLGALPGVRLVALFGPEHGIRGTAEAGEKVESGRDARTGLPVHSLYGRTQKPTPEMLEGVEALVVDIQDIGARPYTYVYTMALAMEAASEQDIPFVVLDRPNPIGGTAVEGNLLDTAFASFVGMYPIPMRHGMTAGELARLFNGAFGIGAALTVVPVEGWRRSMWFDETGLAWTAPSPNIPRLESAVHYPGTVLVEGTNLSEGRGTDRPFEQLGAPWLDAEAVVRHMDSLALPGVRFEAVAFTPREGTRKYGGESLRGVRLVLTDRERYRPVRTAVLLLDAVRRLHPDRFEWTTFADRLAGTDRLRLARSPGEVEALLAAWERDAERFRRQREAYLLY